MHHRGRKIMAWLLTASVALSSSSVTALAGELDFTDVQVAGEQETTVAEMDGNEELVTEFPVQQEEQAEASMADEEGDAESEVDLTVESEDTSEAEIEAETLTDVEAEADINVEEEELFSAGDSEENYSENYYFPGDEVILPGWGRHVDRLYDGYLENEENPGEMGIQTEVTNVSVVNDEDETDTTPVCRIEESEDEDGWEIYAERPGTAVVTLTYKDSNKEEKTYTYRLYVSTDKYTLEPQWGASEGRMLKNSTMEVEVILRHQWMDDEGEQDETVNDWSLEFAPDEENWTYDQNILQNVAINNKEKKITVESGDETGGTNILLKASIASEDGTVQEVAEDCIYVEVCDEYDVLYPEYMENINVGDTLNLNETELGLRVEHVKENEEPVIRDDVTLEYDYDTEQWEDITEDESRPVLKRATTDRTWLDIRAIDGEGQEICGRHYEFDEINCEVYFEGLRDDDYSTYFYDDEDGELQLVTKGLDDDNTEIVWKVGYRKEDQEGDEDSFVEASELPSADKFWSEKADNDHILEINGEKLSAAYKWLIEKSSEDYWFEVRAYVRTNEIEVRMAQAGINTRETKVEYYFPGDQVLLPNWWHHVDRSYNTYIENKENLEGNNIEVQISGVSVANAEDEEDDTPVCKIVNNNENGWDIQPQRIGTAVVTIRYNDVIEEEEKEYSYNLYVSGDKYTLEPQWTASGSRMRTNSEMKLSFVLRHEWQYSDEEEGEEEIGDWTLDFAPDENGWKYDAELLPKVEINGHELTIASGDGDWGSDILLKAMISQEDGTYEEVTSENVRIDVCNEYDVLYPENIDNVKAGGTLDLNNLDLKVKHVKEDGSTFTRNDITYEFEYDGENNWKNTATGDQLPILTRLSTDETWLNIIVRDKDGEEIERREYRFDEVESPLQFEDLRRDDYWTFLYKKEDYTISVNKENLAGLDATIKWKVISRENGSEKITEIPEDLQFWSFDEDDDSTITINGEKLATAQATVESYGYYWYEVQACVVVGEIELNSYAAFGLEKVRDEMIDSFSYFPVQSNQQILMTETLWVPEEYNCWVEDGEHPFGGFVTEAITGIESTNNSAVLITKKEKGWVIKPLEKGKYTLRFSFVTPLGNEERELTFRFYEKEYWMEISFSDDNNQIVPGETKLIDVAVYYRTDSDSKTLVSPSEYTLSADCSAAKSISVNKAKSQISLTARPEEEPYTLDVRVDVTLNEKYENYDQAPVWYTDDSFGISVAPTHDDVLALTRYIEETPERGEAFDLNAYGPVLKRYDNSKKQWEEVKDNVRFRLEYDEEIWTATEATKEDPIPVLIKNRKDATVLRLVAEELVYNPKYGREAWTEVAERYIGIQDSKCEHNWEITEEKAATCGTDGKIHKKCTICAKEKDEIIPATGEHSYEWVIDRNASCSAEGSKHEECKVCHVTGTTESIQKTAHVYEWKTDASATCGADGSRHEECKFCGSKGKTEKLSATGAHVLGEWTVTKSATAVAEGVRERHCTVCGGAKETGSIEKLKPSVTLNVPTNKKLPLKVKQSFQVKVSDFATGDRVISWTSSNKKTVTVSGNGKITGKKVGQAVITVTLQSGLTAKFTVKVQKTTVTTTSLLVVNKATGVKIPKTVSLKAKQKLTLLTAVTPVTSKQKVTYSSSNKKIATVNSKGVITAKKKGTVTITVKSGKKSVKVKIKVTK